MFAKWHNLVFYFSMLLVVAACRKNNLPKEPDQNPVFYLKGELNNQPIKLEAGNDHYFMDASFEWDTTKVCLFKSDLRQKSCSGNCSGYAISVLLNDAKTSDPNTSISLIDVLRLGKYPFNDADLPSLFYKVNLTPLNTKMDSCLYHWTIKSALYNPIEMEDYCPSIQLKANQVYSISLNYEHKTICSSIHENVFKIKSQNQATVSGTRNQNVPGAVYDFSFKSNGAPPFQCFWDFGDGNVSNLENPNHSYQVVLNGKSRVKLRLIDANQDTCISYYQAQTSGDPSCDANFIAEFIGLPNTKAYSSVTILITDPSGKVYSTKNLTQPISSYFEVIEISDYQLNPDNNPTKKVKLNLNCVLKNGNDQIQLKNAELSLAFAYKP